MKITDWKISSWLLLAFTMILLLVSLQGLISYRQTRDLSVQTETMYNHPLIVRRAIDNLQLDVAEMRLEFRNLLLADSPEKEQEALNNMKIASIDVNNQLDLITVQYLGPEQDIVDIKEAYALWILARDENIEELEEGNVNDVLNSISSNGEEAQLRDDLLAAINVVDNYAQNKADELYLNSVQLHNNMVRQLVLIVSSIFALTILIGIWLYRSFKVPLTAMYETVLSFEGGDLSSRVDFVSLNELGTLSNSINNMADTIESNEKIHVVTNEFSDLIIVENDLKTYFKVVLNALLNYTDSVASSIHIFDSKHAEFELIESIGLDQELIHSNEEFTSLLNFTKVVENMSIEIIHLDVKHANIVYNTIAVGIVPKSVMTIPLIENEKVIAIICLMNLSEFTENHVEVINRIIDTLTSRTQAILAQDKINEFILELEQRSNELVAQNAELELQKRQLNQASKLKTNFLSNMSHELRTPLNSVIALTGVLYDRLQNKIDEEEYSYLEIIGRNGKHLLNLINDILDISRIESGHVEVDVSNFNINTVIKDLLNMFFVESKEKGIALEHMNSEETIMVRTDYDKVVHIIQNLLSNAVKFTTEGSVQVQVNKRKKHFEIVVKDTGIGIDKENIEKIFEEFQQAESGTSRRFGGTGLGLAISRSYAKMLQGDIIVDSTPNVGSTFKVVLPLVYTGSEHYELNPVSEVDVITPVSNKKMDLKQVQETKTILLIDDNETIYIQVKDLIQGMGVNLITAENGSKGLEMLDTHKVDGIILDLMMPGVDGFEVLKQVRNNDKTSDIPVLVLTAKHLTKTDLSMLQRNQVYQLVQKGDVDRIELQKSIFNMLFMKHVKIKRHKKGDNLSILIVEDNPDNRTTMKAVLRNIATIIEAEDGELGVQYAMEYQPDLILMDIALPKLNGIEAFHKIRLNEDLKATPIIAITASALEDEKENILAHGFSHFVAKPFTKEELMSAIEEVLYGNR